MLLEERKGTDRVRYFLKRNQVGFYEIGSKKKVFIFADKEAVKDTTLRSLLYQYNNDIIDAPFTLREVSTGLGEKNSKFHSIHISSDQAKRLKGSLDELRIDIVLNHSRYLNTEIIFGFVVEYDYGSVVRLFRFDRKLERHIDIKLVYMPNSACYQVGIEDGIFYEVPSNVECQLNGMLCFMKLAGQPVNFMENEEDFWLVEFTICGSELTMLHGTEGKLPYLESVVRVDVNNICGIEAICKNLWNQELKTWKEVI